MTEEEKGGGKRGEPITLLINGPAAYARPQKHMAHPESSANASANETFASLCASKKPNCVRVRLGGHGRRERRATSLPPKTPHFPAPVPPLAPPRLPPFTALS